MTFSSVSSPRCEIGDDAAVAEHVDVVAVLELVDLGRVPEEGAALGRLLADEVVDLELGADVDAAHRIVHQDDPRVRAERAGEQRLLLVAAGQRQDVVVDVGRADADLLLPGFGQLGPRAPARSAAPCAARRSTGCRCSWRSTTAGRCRRTARSPATSATGAFTSRRVSAPSRGLEDVEQEGASGRGRRDRQGRRSRPHGRQARYRRPASAAARGHAPACRRGDARLARRLGGGLSRRSAPPIVVDQPVAVEGARGSRSQPPCRRASRRCGRSFRGSRRAGARSGRNSRRRPPTRRTKASSWPAVWASSEEVGSSRMTRRSGSSVTVKARATSTIWRRPIDRSPTTSAGPMPWPGKISSSLAMDELAGAPAPAEAGEVGMVDARVLGDGEIRAERQFLEDAADAELLGDADRIGGLTRARR